MPSDDAHRTQAHQAIFVPTTPLPSIPSQPVVKGHDFGHHSPSTPFSFSSFLDQYATVGFQATALKKAMDIVNQMRCWTLADDPVTTTDNTNNEEKVEEEEEEETTPSDQVKCTIFLGYTSNLVSSGLRDTFRYLAENKMINVIVTTAGGIEEDLIKCLADTYVGDFHLPGAQLRRHGINRIGNLLVPNENYCKFETWVTPILDACLDEQLRTGVPWTPSRIIAKLGEHIQDPRSIYYWCWKHSIPVFCPALTDGSLGDMMYFHSIKRPGLVVDVVKDIRAINDMAVFAKKTGMIILGGGVVKHHICNANLMRNGADYAVFINTAQEFDGSDAGARPDEAVSWGKIRTDGQSVKVYADATIVFPLLVANTFAKSALNSVDGVIEKE